MCLVSDQELIILDKRGEVFLNTGAQYLCFRKKGNSTYEISLRQYEVLEFV
jgi:hypothetical protein